ncbi:metallophosphoesterase [Thermogemmatispora sp.]|uniref:metallophosphoesterase n=1 Tax=Thermogemmatispora sp. TaxID=1968838 RepID=UPI001DB5A2CD|nr:metallophosphoesterase [Thermogemmatispora sp.]MBX5451505.1 metallophosphoesterase [Thermogemmatispora sp.]
MSVTILVVSDLHLADGQVPFEGFAEEQERAWKEFLRAASPGGLLTEGKEDDTVELVINGDCFDFLATSPLQHARTRTVAQALEKLERIIAAHGSFFEALAQFLSQPQRRLTFVPGNHDIELLFPAIQQRLRQVLSRSSASEEQLRFWQRPRYEPLPTIAIEHGNFYDFWNHRSAGLWTADGEPLPPHEEILLSAGSWYYQEAGALIHRRFPYFEHLEPSLSYPSQMALLALLAPELLCEVVTNLVRLISRPRQPLAGLRPSERQMALRLFEEAMQDLAAFQRDMQRQKKDWQPVPGWDEQQATAALMEDYLRLREALVEASQPTATEETRRAAVARIFGRSTTQQLDSTAAGMCALLQREPRLRYALAGHTHSWLVQPLANGYQYYLNTGTWTRRLARPRPEEMTPAMFAWLYAPHWPPTPSASPLREVTQYTFALIRAAEDGSPSTASLCAWEIASQPTYRVLAAPPLKRERAVAA